MSKKRSVINWPAAAALVISILVIVYIIYVDGGKGL